MGRHDSTAPAQARSKSLDDKDKLYDDTVAQAMAAMLYRPHEPFTSLSAQASLWVG